jgi:hypothetical protein
MADGPDIGIGSSTATPPPAPPDSSASSTPPTAPPDSSANPPAPPSDAMIRARAGTPEPAGRAETQAWQTAQGIAPTSQAAAPVVLQPLKRHGLAGVMDEVGKFLTGTQGGEVYIDQDGKKYIQHPPQTHAQQWARVGLEALQGGARGLAAGQGPGGKGRAFLASVQGGINDRQQADALKDEEATKSWQMQRQAKIDKATMQIQQMKIAEMALAHDRQGFEFTAEKQKFSDEQQDRYRAMGGHAIPGYYSSEDFHEIKKVAPNVWNDHFEKANIMPVHTAQGVQFWEIPPDRMDAPLPAHTKGRLWVPDDSKEGGHTEHPELPEGSVERDLEMMNNKWTLDSGAALERRTKSAQATTEEVKAQYAPQTAQADIDEKKAGIREKRASADLAEQKATNLRNTGSEDVNAGAALNEPPVNGVRQGYLASLPAGTQALVREIGEGRKTDVNISRSPAQQLLARQVALAYPGYDFTRAPAYAATRKAFTSGKPADGINAINTAMMHMETMYDNASWLASMPVVGAAERFMGNQKAINLKDSKTALVGELGRAYQAGAITEKDKDAWTGRVEAWSPQEIRGNAKAFIGLLSGKLEGLQNQWKSGSPPAAVSPIPIFGPGAQGAYQHIMGVPYQEPNSGGGGGAPAPGGGVTYNFNGTPLTFQNQAALEAWKQRANIQ